VDGRTVDAKVAAASASPSTITHHRHQQKTQKLLQQNLNCHKRNQIKCGKYESTSTNKNTTIACIIASNGQKFDLKMLLQTFGRQSLSCCGQSKVTRKHQTAPNCANLICNNKQAHTDTHPHTQKRGQEHRRKNTNTFARI